MSLKVVNLSKRYNDMWALRDVSLETATGEVFGLFGPAGSGKTTLLKAIEGKFPLNGGSVQVNTTDVTALAGTARKITVPEYESPSIWRRVFNDENSATKVDARSRAVLRAIESADSVLLLDDPLCGMDAGEREALADKIRNVARERGVSVLFASNDFGQILRACDRAAVIVKGEIKQSGPPQEIYEKPESRVVAYVTGRNNLFAARRLTSSKAETPEFFTIDGGHRLFAQRIERGALGALNQNVTLAIRPEQVSISFGASFPEDNLLKASVRRIQCLGPTTLIELDADGLRLDALVLRVVGLDVGAECMVGLPPDRIQIFRD
ncbi:MAG: ABC transporter ATP-binding protein [Acidobacteriota bacterium]